jgi:hypothetical protein
MKKKRNTSPGGAGGKSPRKGVGPKKTGGQNPTADAFLDNADPFQSYMRGLSGAGINPYGPTDYQNWLQNDAYNQYEGAFYDALKASKGKQTRNAFNTNYFASNKPAYSENAYMPTHIQNNQQDYYGKQATAAGWNMNGASPYERYLRGEGMDVASRAYGQAQLQNPSLLYMNFMQPNYFGRPRPY